MYRRLFLPALLMLAVACNDAGNADHNHDFGRVPKTTEDSLFDEVMHGHDTAMAKMGKLKRYEREVTAKIDSLKKLGGNKLGEAEKSLEQLAAELRAAQEGMNKWMDEFSIDSAQEDLERRIEYLKSEKLRVDKVADKIFSTLKKADSLLTK